MDTHLKTQTIKMRFLGEKTLKVKDFLLYQLKNVGI